MNTKEEIKFYKAVLDTFVNDSNQDEYVFPSNQSSHIHRKLIKHATRLGLSTDICGAGTPFSFLKSFIIDQNS